MTKSRHKDTDTGPVSNTGTDTGTGTGPVADTDTDTGTDAATDADTGTGTGTDTDTDTGTGTDAATDADTGTGTGTDAGAGEINPSKKGSVPFFSARRVLGGGGLRFGPRSLGARLGAALLVLMGNTRGPNARTSRGVLLRSR